MNLSRIGFYTLTDDRARNATSTSQMMRGELILSSRCNFKCPYCRSVGGPDIDIEKAKEIINLWADEGLKKAVEV
jgi:sulfatase maturation enzyme AslB (radical SAM superfamily)